MAIFMTISTSATELNPHHVVELGLTPSAFRKMGKKALLGRQAACLAEYAAHPESPWAKKVLMIAHQADIQLSRRYGISNSASIPMSIRELWGF